MTGTLFDPVSDPVSDAVLSDCGRYRYTLLRVWDETNPRRVCWIMLNPSTADAATDDPTIRRCIGFSRSWGYGGMEVVNLFAYRATDPADLKAAPQAWGGMLTNWHMEQVVNRCEQVIVAWGAHGSYLDRDRAVCHTLRRIGKPVFCLGTTAAGQPRHPLYLPGSTRPVPFDVVGEGG